jgi:hypothetical protein
MQLTAWLEAERIEISQDARVVAGAKSPNRNSTMPVPSGSIDKLRNVAIMLFAEAI